MKISRMLCFFIAFALILPTSTPAAPSYGASFYDTGGHWAESYINQAVNYGIVQGYPDSTFRPDNPVSRAEFSSMINKLLKNTSTSYTAFYDVAYGSWYYQDVTKGVAAAYISGYTDNSFAPDSPITRQEAATIISRVVTASGSTGNLNSYTDSYTIADWAYGAFEKVNGKGYMGVYPDGKLHPHDQLTRAQATKILCDIQGKEKIVATDTVVRNASTLSNTIYSNGVTIHSDLKTGNVTLENCVVLGNLDVNSGANTTVTLSNSRIANARIGDSFSSANLLRRGDTVIVNMSNPGGGYNNNNDSGDNEDDGDVTFSPKDGARNVGLSTKITITFASPMRLYDGGAIYSEDIEDIISVREGSSNGDDVPYSGSISSSKRVITLDPDYRLEQDTTYYVIIPRNEFKDSDGHGNKSYSIRFSTGNRISDSDDGDDDDDIIFDPENEDTGVSRGVEPMIEFPMAVITYDGEAVTKDYLQDAIVFREDSSSGRRVSFTAGINYAKDTITITPKNDLKDDQDYYFGISSKKFRYRSTNEIVGSKHVTFTVGKTVIKPDVYDIRISASTGSNSITASAKPNYTGAMYALLLEDTEPAPDKNTVKSRGSKASVSKDSSRTFTFNNLKAGTDYKCYFVLNAKSGDSNPQASGTARTPAPPAPPATVNLGPGSAGSPGDKEVTNLRVGKYYTIEHGGVIQYVKADGTCSSNWTDAGSLSGTKITGLTNDETYMVKDAAFQAGASTEYWDHSGVHSITGAGDFPGAKSSATVTADGLSLPLPATSAAISVVYGIDISSLVSPIATSSFNIMKTARIPDPTNAYAVSWSGPRYSATYNYSNNTFERDSGTSGAEVGVYKVPLTGGTPEPAWLAGKSIIYAPVVTSVMDYLFYNTNTKALTVLTVKIGNAAAPVSASAPLSIAVAPLPPDANAETSSDPIIKKGPAVVPASLLTPIDNTQALKSPAPGVFGLIYPANGAISTMNKAVTVNVANGTKIVVIKGGLMSGQKAAVNKAGVYYKPDETDKAKSAYTVTISTIEIAEGGGKIEFPITISESGKTNIVYNVTVNVAK